MFASSRAEPAHPNVCQIPEHGHTEHHHAQSLALSLGVLLDLRDTRSEVHEARDPSENLGLGVPNLLHSTSGRTG